MEKLFDDNTAAGGGKRVDWGFSCNDLTHEEFLYKPEEVSK